MTELDFAGLLELSRRKANSRFYRRYPTDVRHAYEDVRKRMVVREFLERICPIRVDEAYDF